VWGCVVLFSLKKGSRRPVGAQRTSFAQRSGQSGVALRFPPPSRSEGGHEGLHDETRTIARRENFWSAVAETPGGVADTALNGARGCVVPFAEEVQPSACFLVLSIRTVEYWPSGRQKQQSFSYEKR
jgi:hypothetical protein